jgi:hypothetical protein
MLQFEHEVRTNIDGITVKGIQDIQAQLTPVHTTTTNNSVPQNIFEVQRSRNQFFVGRDQELQILHSRLRPSPSSPSQQRGVCVIHSMGGVGKTQLALEYTYKFQKDYDCIFWLDAETGPELAAQFAALAKYTPDPAQNMSGSSTLFQDIERARNWLQTTGTFYEILVWNLRSYGLPLTD